MESEGHPEGSWGIPLGGELVLFDNADAVMLLTAARGLAGALVHAGDIALAIKVPAAYLRMSVNEAGSPVSALAHVTTPTRAFSGVCLTDALTMLVEAESLSVPVRLVRSIRGSAYKTGWRPKGRTNVELIDGSVYRHVRIQNPQVSVLSLLGCQAVDVSSTGVLVQGHSIRELSELRNRLRATLERNEHAFLKTIGSTTFEGFFRRAA